MCNIAHNNTNSHWEYDVRGIPLARVCGHCAAEVLSRYSSRVLTEEQQLLAFGSIQVTEDDFYCDEPLDEDY